MPAMDGIAVSKKIRQELGLTMPIIMMTAFGKEAQRIEAEKAGINGFLTKPIYPSTLFDAIMDGFGKAGAKGVGRKKQFTTRASIYRKPLKGIRVLVAEDNFTNQQVARAILEGAGIVATIVGNGEAAVQAVGETAFDAVLMDIQMPRMNGYEATRRIRELPQGASIPIVAMTAHAMKGDEEKCLEAGMDGYISKPVNQDRLFHTLWRLLRARRHLSEALAPEDGEFPADPMTDGGETPQDERLTASDISPEKDGLLAATLPGIDIAQTLAALHLDGTTFSRILIGFRADNRETAQQLTQALNANDLERMSQLAHGLKGSAANIGAVELKTTAQALEEACHGNFSMDVDASRLAGLVAGVASALDQVLDSIQRLEESGVGDAAGPASAETGLPVVTLLKQLAEAIDRADPESIMQIMPALKQQADRCNPIDPFSLKTLEEQLNRYDYDQAMETIRKISDSRQGAP
jgi:CheY-like chemotaxis protein